MAFLTTVSSVLILRARAIYSDIGQRMTLSRSSRPICRCGYGKPSAKALVSDPGDEAPFLVRGEARGAHDARGCLTVGSRPARIGIDVLVRSKHEAVMGTKPREERTPPKPKTPTFLLELPLVAEAGQAARLGAHLEVGRQFYNAVLSEGQRRLRRMRADPAQSRRPAPSPVPRGRSGQ